VILSVDKTTPSYLRMYLNLIIFLLLLLPVLKKGLSSRMNMTEKEIKEESSSKTETASVMSFSVGIATVVLGFMVSITHDINGTQYFPYLVATFYVGLFLNLSGLGLLILSKLLPSGNSTKYQLPTK
jgi:putative Mn2+ efflux pump MntP